MKLILDSIIFLFYITSIILHIWTVIIAYIESGILGALISLGLPILSEFYWMFKMFGVNNTYAYISLIHTVLAFPLYVYYKSR